MLNYSVNENLILLEERRGEEDYEFLISTVDEKAHNTLMELRSFFEGDDVFSDVLFYSLKNKKIQVIVRRDLYVSFILGLFKWKLLKRVNWSL
ncbi:hypothetical protein ACN6MY_13375 [Peribacillus sp. B-H-3]|jgi:hypothetical protein|uniref:hypothetical protein n=1 Tax=Peribacillus sp. B-H-3 TaxID=3400420 RepID=UPI003B0264E2